MSVNSCQWLDESIPTGGARSERTAPEHDRWENVAVEADPADMPNRSAWTAAEMVFNFGSSGLDAEEVAVMAADSGCTVEAYCSQMLKSDTWGDELMIGMLSLTQRIAITLMTPVYCRTWSADGVV